MKKLPIIINSPDFQFVIVGPIGLHDGILIQSSSTTDDLIGYAHLKYRTKMFEKNNESLTLEEQLVFKSISKNYSSAWSSPIKISNPNPSDFNIEKREFKIMLCFESKRNLSITNSNLIIDFFKTKAFDIYSNLIDNTITLSLYESIIRLQVSPIALLGATKNN